MSAAPRLPFVLDPVAGESFSGWLGRLARLYAGSAAGLLRRLGLDAAYDGDRPHQTTVTGLAEACSLDPRRFEAMTLGPERFCDPALSRRLALSRPPQRLGPFLLFDGRRRFCPVCLDDADPIWPLSWRAGLPICSRHRVWLERACGRCGTALSSLGPEPPARCAVCFTPFRTAPPDPAPDTALLADLGARIAAKPPVNLYAQDWACLGQQARGFARDSGSRAPRAAFAEFLSWAERAGVRLPRVVQEKPHCTAPIDQQAPSPPKPGPPDLPALRRPDPLAGLRRRSLKAVAEARRQLIAEGQGITERAWRRRADRLLLIEGACESTAYGTMTRSGAPQSTG